MSDNGAQKRAYFRMDALLPMSYRVLTAEEARNPLPATVDTLFVEQYFSTELDELDSRIDNIIEQIAEKSSLMAAALRAMNEKLNFLTQTLGDDAIKYVIPTIPVNISAGGLSFDTAVTIEHGAIVDLLLVLNKQDGPIMLRSQVVKVIPHPDGTSMMALEFQHMGEEARRQLVYFIQTKEIELAREKRGS
jgi:hypothetical protein